MFLFGVVGTSTGPRFIGEEDAGWEGNRHQDSREHQPTGPDRSQGPLGPHILSLCGPCCHPFLSYSYYSSLSRSTLPCCGFCIRPQPLGPLLRHAPDLPDRPLPAAGPGCPCLCAGPRVQPEPHVSHSPGAPQGACCGECPSVGCWDQRAEGRVGSCHHHSYIPKISVKPARLCTPLLTLTQTQGASPVSPVVAALIFSPSMPPSSTTSHRDGHTVQVPGLQCASDRLQIWGREQSPWDIFSQELERILMAIRRKLSTLVATGSPRC